jgi:hypothetical protein
MRLDQPRRTNVSSSKRIGCVLGPALMAVLVSEFPLVQPHLYDDQIPPVVYLSGVLMFVAGLAIVRVHNLWRPDWTIFVTLSGWFLLILGLVRMFAAGAYQRSAGSTGTGVFMFLEAGLFVVAAIITFKSYKRDDD